MRTFSIIWRISRRIHRCTVRQKDFAVAFSSMSFFAAHSSSLQNCGCFAQKPQQPPPSTMCLEFSVVSLAKYISYNLGPISESRVCKNSVYVKPEMRESMFSISQSQLSLTQSQLLQQQGPWSKSPDHLLTMPQGGEACCVFLWTKLLTIRHICQERLNWAEVMRLNFTPWLGQHSNVSGYSGCVLSLRCV